MLDKYGTGQDPYCLSGTSVLNNRLGLTTDEELNEAERVLSTIAANEINFELPPYDLPYLCRIHRQLFGEIYAWAGEFRTVDISKGTTHFCNVLRIEPEANKLFRTLAKANWFEGLNRLELVTAVAELFGDLNMIHPFREGNGRAQRVLFEHIVINAGYQISWWAVEEEEWVQANVEAVTCDYRSMTEIFERCIGEPIC
ncbi:putative adenosine monophosphate-protein transferase Fic [Stutzerimonas kunmingensis]|uniref:putative adenosine monophosphate-protein transferase Fic n=1 Tax=Stutzerimonas kunmingensis TaxID=1211807 RepID=UPI0028B1736C|nr:putative adenosine monophosphate-protein transferase Fic [Stutzerimonas kunmingensis]